MTINDLDVLRAKAAALDRTVAWLQGRTDSEKLMEVMRMLRAWQTPDGKPRR